MTIGRRIIRVIASSEAGRVDANSAEPDAFDARLREAGVEPAERVRLSAAIIARRRSGQRIGSLAELRSVITPAANGPSRDTACLLEHLAVTTALTRPITESGQSGVAGLSAAYPLRLVATSGEALGLVVIARIGGGLIRQCRRWIVSNCHNARPTIEDTLKILDA